MSHYLLDGTKVSADDIRKAYNEGKARYVHRYTGKQGLMLDGRDFATATITPVIRWPNRLGPPRQILCAGALRLRIVQTDKTVP
jgi:hypothetical protein